MPGWWPFGSSSKEAGTGALYTVHFNQPAHAAVPKETRTNYISTTKYNVFTFLPLNLFGQV